MRTFQNRSSRHSVGCVAFSICCLGFSGSEKRWSCPAWVAGTLCRFKVWDMIGWSCAQPLLVQVQSRSMLRAQPASAYSSGQGHRPKGTNNNLQFAGFPCERLPLVALPNMRLFWSVPQRLFWGFTHPEVHFGNQLSQTQLPNITTRERICKDLWQFPI